MAHRGGDGRGAPGPISARASAAPSNMSLLGGVTDRPEHASEVARLVRRTGLPAKVNLIAWNPGPGIPYQMPAPESVEAFRSILTDAGVPPAFVRKPRGRDIYAACGQLKRTVEG